MDLKKATIVWHSTTPKKFKCSNGCCCCCSTTLFFPDEFERLSDQAKKGIIKDKFEYYEHIDEEMFNMTTMGDTSYFMWSNFIGNLESLWLLVKTTDAYKIELDKDYFDKFGGETYKIWAVCPYCTQDIVYRQYLPSVGKHSHIGTGCTKCNKKIRINLKYYA